MKIFQSWIFFLLIFLFSEIAYAQNLAYLIENSPNQEAFWSVTVRDETGRILESYNPKKLIIPASNQKLFTTAAVLDEFGSDFRYQTNIYGEGALIDSIWNGDLIIKGSGDPSISGFHFNGDRYFVFDRFLQQLKEKGIKSISGNLIADVSLFDADFYPKGWDWYDLSFYYGVQISPLSFNNNAVDLEVLAEGNVGETPLITWFPDSTDYVDFINRQVIAPSNTEYDEYYRRQFGNNSITLASSLPQGYFETESLSIDNPPLFFLNSFSDYLNENGIDFSGSLNVSYGQVADSSQLILASHFSPPMSELVSWLNKESDNFYAEMLLKTLSAHRGTQPASFEDGVEQVRDFLGGLGVDTTFVIMKDGSGLAGGNFTQTFILSSLLQKMLNHAEVEAYKKSLPIAGIDGSLSYRMKEKPLFNNFRGKTGYVAGVRTLSGYLEAASGDEIIVSIATNHFEGDIGPVDRTHEKILEFLFEKY